MSDRRVFHFNEWWLFSMMMLYFFLVVTYSQVLTTICIVFALCVCVFARRVSLLLCLVFDIVATWPILHFAVRYD